MSLREWASPAEREAYSPSVGSMNLPVIPYAQRVPQVNWTGGVPVSGADALSASRVVGEMDEQHINSQALKALPRGIKPARGPRARFYDPLSLIYATGFRDRRFSLTYDSLRRVSYQLGLLAAIMLTRVNQVAAFSQPYRDNRQVGFAIRYKDELKIPDENERRAIQRMEQFVQDCGWGPNPYSPYPRDDFETFIKKFVRDSLTFDQGCLLPGSWVELADGTGVPIEKIYAGMKVRSHTGHCRKVIKPTRRLYSGDMVSMQVQGQRLEMTGGHPLFVAKKTSCDGDAVKVVEPEWVEARSVKPGMYVTYPRPKLPEEPVALAIFDDIPRRFPTGDLDRVASEVGVHRQTAYQILAGLYGKNGPTVERVLRKAEEIGVRLEAKRIEEKETVIDEEWGRFLGLYVAEGNVNGNTVRLTFHVDERELVNFVREFGERCGITSSLVTYEDRQGITVLLSSTALASFLTKEVGTGSQAKKIPSFMFCVSQDVRDSFLRGYLEGDGCLKSTTARFSTVSRDLFTGLRVLFGSNGIYIAEVQEDRSSHGWSTIYQGSLSGLGYLEFARRVGLPVSVPSREYRSYIVGDDYFYICVSSVKSYEVVDTPVYNMEVEEDHSYIANGFISHNCFEVIPDQQGRPYEFRTVDASTVRLAATYDGYRGEKPRRFQSEEFTDRWRKEYGEAFTLDGDGVFAIQLMHGRIENIYTYHDLAFCVRNPRSDVWINGYGFAEAEMALNVVIRLLWAEEYNARIFRQGSMASGILNFKGDQIDPQQLECLPEDVLVQTDKGIYAIVKAYEIQQEGVKLRFWNGIDYAPGFVFESGIKEINKIVLDDGMTLRASKNHRVFVLTANGLEERFVEDLMIGDVLAQNDASVECENPPLSALVETRRSFKKRTHPESNDFVCEDIEEDLWEFIGWQVGDGWLANNHGHLLMFYHGEKDLDVFNRHQEVMDKYGIRYKEQKVKEGVNMRTWQICYVPFCEFLRGIGLCSGGNKEVPWLVFAQSASRRAAFLRGLFSADGYVSTHGYTVGITSVYPKLLDGVQQLLNTLGLNSYRNKHSHENAQQLLVRRRELFIERVGFCQAYKNEKVASTKTQNTPADHVPVDLLANLLEPYKERVGREIKGSSQLGKAISSVVNKQKFIRVVARQYWREFFKSVGDERATKLLSYRFSRIVEINDDGVEATYDVTIREGYDPRFIANGVLTHNSFRRTWQAQVSGVENCLHGDTKIWTQEEGSASIQDTIGELDERKVNIWTGTEWAEGLVYRTSQSKQECYTRLGNGAEITTSPNHKFFVLDEDGLPGWREQRELVEGDLVLIEKKQPGCEPKSKVNKSDKSEWMSSFYCEPVVKLESFDRYIQMFDVSVETPEHRFVANGIITHNSHRIPIIQVPEGVEFINMGPKGGDMEYQRWVEYLLKILCAVFQIDSSEINFDLVTGAGSGGTIFESKHEWKIKHSRDKGLRPLLRWVAKQISKYVIDPLDDRMYLDFIGLDMLSEQDRITLLTQKVSNYMTINEGRREEGLEPVPGGDIINNPTYFQSYQAEQQSASGAEEDALSPWDTVGDSPDPGYGEATPIPLYFQQGIEEDSGGDKKEEGGGDMGGFPGM